MAKSRLSHSVSIVLARLRGVWQLDASISSSDYDLRQQADHLSARLPVLYLIFAINVILVAITCGHRFSPLFGTVMPTLLVGICVMRARYWFAESVRVRKTSKLRHDIKRLQFVGPVIVVALISWIMSLYPEATSTQRGIIAYVIGSTTVAGTLTLVDVPRTAILGAAAALLPFSIIVIGYGTRYELLMICCHMAVTGMLTIIAIRHYRELDRLIRTAKQLGKGKAAIQKYASELERLSSIDPLTEAHNRRAILSRIEAGLADADNPTPWLVLLDLNGFKKINDTYGHAAGDAALQAVARRIASHKAVITLGRIGGDEFAILVGGQEDKDSLLKICDELSSSIARAINWKGIRLRLRASMGARRTRRLSLGEEMERADFALYQAKKVEGSTALFDAEMEIVFAKQKRIAIDFESSDLTASIDVVFQPIFDFDTRKVLSVEALARWKRNEASVVMPDIFIELAESSGRMSEITDRVIFLALEQAVKWPENVEVQINLSPHDLARDGCSKHIERAIAAHEISPSRITFELTETTLVTNQAKFAKTIEEIRALGCRVALDDFGTGYSSLAYLNRFLFDQIKLDREFASKLDHGSTAAAIASTVLTLAQKIGVTCTIEGIETLKQATAARSLGFRRMQGFFLARPLNAPQLWDLLFKSSVSKYAVGSRKDVA